MIKDYKKISKTRRQRGYHWEDTIVKRFCSLDDWNSVRLGSPSNALPDVMSVNNSKSLVVAIEAKSTVGNFVYVPQDQIERCAGWVDRFQKYDFRIVVLAFKFGQIKGKRKLRNFYKIFPYMKILPSKIKGDQHGNTWIKSSSGWLELKMENFET